MWKKEYTWHETHCWVLRHHCLGMFVYVWAEHQGKTEIHWLEEQDRRTTVRDCGEGPVGKNRAGKNRGPWPEQVDVERAFAPLTGVCWSDVWVTSTRGCGAAQAVVKLDSDRHHRHPEQQQQQLVRGRSLRNRDRDTGEAWEEEKQQGGLHTGGWTMPQEGLQGIPRTLVLNCSDLQRYEELELQQCIYFIIISALAWAREFNWVAVIVIHSSLLYSQAGMSWQMWKKCNV